MCVRQREKELLSQDGPFGPAHGVSQQRVPVKERAELFRTVMAADESSEALQPSSVSAC